MDDGPYAFGQRVEVRLLGSGDQLTLWTGITTINGQPDLDRCLGVLPRRFLEQLATEVFRRLQPVPQPPAASTTNAAMAAGGRRSRKPRKP